MIETFPDVSVELIQEAMRACHKYVGSLEAQYLERSAWRAKNGYPVLSYQGLGRSGKDTAAQHVAEISELKYGGSTSNVVLPLIAHSLGVSEDDAWDTRHKNRTFWFNWCNLFRQLYGQETLARYLLGLGDFVVGLRSDIEVRAVHKAGLVTHWVWVERPGVADDPTVEFNWKLIQSLHGLRLSNEGALAAYLEKVRAHAWMAGLAV